MRGARQGLPDSQPGALPFDPAGDVPRPPYILAMCRGCNMPPNLKIPGAATDATLHNQLFFITFNRCLQCWVLHLTRLIQAFRRLLTMNCGEEWLCLSLTYSRS